MSPMPRVPGEGTDGGELYVWRFAGYAMKANIGHNGA